MGIYHNTMEKEVDRKLNVKAAYVDNEFFVFTQLEEFEDYSEIVDYWIQEIDKALMGVGE